jgi:hypothetical protein
MCFFLGYFIFGHSANQKLAAVSRERKLLSVFSRKRATGHKVDNTKEI